MSVNAALYDFMIGEWTVEFQRLPEGTKVGHRAIVKVDWFLDGTAILDESGTVNFRGGDLSYVPIRQGPVVHALDDARC